MLVTWIHTGPYRWHHEVQLGSHGRGNKFPAVYLCQTHLVSSKQSSGERERETAREHQQLANVYFWQQSQRGV